MLVMVVFFLTFRSIHLSTPLIRLFLLVLILLLMPTLNFLPIWFSFFFSSRRRHTRYWRDWSSDVCSSDLGADPRGAEDRPALVMNDGRGLGRGATGGQALRPDSSGYRDLLPDLAIWGPRGIHQIGRASCRERV